MLFWKKEACERRYTVYSPNVELTHTGLKHIKYVKQKLNESN